MVRGGLVDSDLEGFAVDNNDIDAGLNVERTLKLSGYGVNGGVVVFAIDNDS